MDTRVQAIINTLHQHIRGQISLNKISKSVNLSETRVRQLFLKETGQSPLTYLKTIRIKRAEELLRNTFLTVKEVAFEAGLTHVSHFSRDFKKRYGMTPSEYRTHNHAVLRTRAASE